MTNDPNDPGAPPVDPHREYDNDRRGEHKYPAGAGDADERPSQRERDELKRRLQEDSHRRV